MKWHLKLIKVLTCFWWQSLKKKLQCLNWFDKFHSIAIIQRWQTLWSSSWSSLQTNCLFLLSQPDQTINFDVYIDNQIIQRRKEKKAWIDKSKKLNYFIKYLHSAKIIGARLECFAKSPYSRGLSPSDYFLFPSLMTMIMSNCTWFNSFLVIKTRHFMKVG